MEIKYLGHASFLIKTKTAKIVTDPYDVSIGMRFPKVSAEIVTISHQHNDHNRFDLVEGEKVVFDFPGEYERLGVRLTGYETYHDKNKGKERGLNIMFKIEAEDITLLHCGDLGEVLKDDYLEKIGDIDILMIPVGGFYTIDADEAVEMVKKIEPSIVIPMHYNHPKLNQEIFGRLTSIDTFLKKMGVETLTPIDKLAVKKEDLVEEMKVVVFS
jgi:L-ascorbate metabolism protein UlaG (beta-lactamase superfamily)